MHANRINRGIITGMNEVSASLAKYRHLVKCKQTFNLPPPGHKTAFIVSGIWHEVTVISSLELIAYSINIIGNDRQPSCHGLQNTKREHFAMRGTHINIDF